MAAARPAPPSLSMPRTGRPFTRPVLVSAALHVGAIALIVWWGSQAAQSAAPAGPGASDPWAGGGGVTFLELPPYVGPAASRPPAVPQPQPQVAVMVAPEPVLESPTLEVSPIAVSAVPLSLPAPGPPGSGGGSGGGVGTGHGPGVGSGTGPGVAGGSEDVVFPPQPKYSILPPLPKPASVRGQAFRVHFWVDASGRVSRVEVSPRIPDGDYRRKFLDLMREYTFTPARRPDGTPIRGETELTIIL